MDLPTRAYSMLEIKSVNADQRMITGVATTPNTDRMGDIVESTGLKFAKTLPLLWQHAHDKPVGHVSFDSPTKNGITFKAQIAKIDESGVLKDRTDEAWQSVKHGLVKGVSIGFRPIKYDYMDKGGIRFEEAEVYELSLVTIPANVNATIQTIRSLDQEFLAKEGGATEAKVNITPGVTGFERTTKVKATHIKMAKRTYTEQIASFESTRAAKAARMDDLMEKAADSGETLDEASSEEFEGLEAEVKAVDEHLVRLRKMEKTAMAEAVSVEGGDTSRGSSLIRAGVPATVRSPDLPKGTAFARYTMALAASRGNLMQAVEISKRWDNSTPIVGDVLKAAVAAGTTTDATWAAPLVNYQVLANEFIDYLRPLTLIGRVDGFRRVPFNVRVPTQSSGSTAYWVGEGQVKPLSALAFSTVSLTYSKVAAIVVMTDELVRFSSPSAENIVREDLGKSIAAKLDRDFIDPTVAATGSSPASITNGVTPITATGVTPDALRTDMTTLIQGLYAANLNLAGGYWIMSQQQAFAISMMRNTLGQPEFPGVTPEGGNFGGYPVVATEAVPGTGGSPTDGSLIIFLLPNQILLADDGTVTIDASREASLQMDTAPDSPPSASTVPVSMFQQNMVAIRAERYINWVKARSTSVAFIQNAKYHD